MCVACVCLLCARVADHVCIIACFFIFTNSVDYAREMLCSTGKCLNVQGGNQSAHSHQKRSFCSTDTQNCLEQKINCFPTLRCASSGWESHQFPMCIDFATVIC